MSEVNSICQTKVSTIFQFESPTYQLAANMTYVYKSTIDNLPANVASGKKYQFKSDLERLQYLMGLFGRASEGRR